jgi:hypothetical protein
MDLKETGCEDVLWMGSYECGKETLGSIKGLNFLVRCVTVSFSRTLLHQVSYQPLHTVSITLSLKL